MFKTLVVSFLSALIWATATPNVSAQSGDPFEQMERMMRMMEKRMQQSMRAFDSLKVHGNKELMKMDSVFTFSDTLTTSDGTRIFRFFGDTMRKGEKMTEGMDDFFREFFNFEAPLGGDEEEMPADDGNRKNEDMLPEERQRQKEDKKSDNPDGIREVKPKSGPTPKVKTYRL